MSILLLLGQIILSHEESLHLLKEYPSESYILNNDIYTVSVIDQVNAFSGTLDGNQYQITNIQFENSNGKVQFFGIFSGTLKNIGLDVAIFKPTSAEKFYGISSLLVGVIQMVSIRVNFDIGPAKVNFFVLGESVSAQISSLHAELVMAASSESVNNECGFFSRLSGAVIGSAFISDFSANVPGLNQFYAMGEHFDSVGSKNITVKSTFSKIQQENFVFQSIYGDLQDVDIWLDIDFVDDNSGIIEDISLLFRNHAFSVNFENVMINGNFIFDVSKVKSVSFIGNQQAFIIDNCFIQYRLKSIGTSNLVFQFIHGVTSDILIYNSTFNVFLDQFVYGNFSVISSKISYSLVKKSLFNLFYDQKLNNIGNVTINGLAFQLVQVDFNYSHFYAKVLPVTLLSSTLQLNAISYQNRMASINFVSIYLIINESYENTGNRMFSGFGFFYIHSQLQNCLQFSDIQQGYTRTIFMQPFLYNLSHSQINNIIIQNSIDLGYLDKLPMISQVVEDSIIRNIVIYGQLTFFNYTSSLTYALIIEKLKSTQITNIFININFLTNNNGFQDNLFFFVWSDQGQNKITNLIQTGVFLGTKNVIKKYDSGLKDVSVISAIYSNESNKTIYNSETQKSFSLHDLKDESFMEKQKLFDKTVWKYKAGVNFDLPVHDYVFLTDKFWELDEYPPFESANTMLVSGKRAKNHFAPKNGPNMCQMDCQGSQIFWDQEAVCKPGFIGKDCSEVDCSSNPCLNGGTCAGGKCDCQHGYTGLLCEIDHCTGCPDACYLVLGDIYRCDAKCESGVNCIQGSCIGNVCKCHPDVSTKLNQSVMCSLTTSCIFNEKCGEMGVCVNEKCYCSEDSVEINDSCYRKVHEDLGECGEVKKDYYCNSCVQERKTPKCVDCSDGFKEFDEECFPICPDCNGVCVILEKGIHCFSCKSNYSVPDCSSCIAGFKEVSDVCFEIANAEKGDCWQDAEKVVCDSCYKNFSMPLCEDCIDGFIKNAGTCYPECPSDICLGYQCYKSPTSGYLCDSCYMHAKLPNCTNCEKGYKLVSSGCYQIIQEAQGDCWDQAGVVRCDSCKNNFIMPVCQQCDTEFLLVANKCYEVCPECQGVNCYFKTPSDSTCDSCLPGYEMPSCTSCTTYYVLKDDLCFEITIVDKGDCWMNGTLTNCSSCLNNYKLPSCNICNDGYQEVGLECLVACEPDKCFGADCYYQPDLTIKCISCNSNFVPPSCIECIPGFINIRDECFEQVNKEKGICYINGITICDTCKDLFLMPLCENCPSDKIEIDYTCQQSCDTCFGVNCFQDMKGIKTCDSCNTSFQLPSCETCIPGFYLYDDKCHQIVPGSNGDCIELAPIIQCFGCSPGYVLSADKTECLLECKSSNCIYGSCQPDQTCQCRPNFTGGKCDGCIPDYGLVGSLCFIINSTTAGKCFVNGTDTLCTSCNAGYEMSLDNSSCYMNCKPMNCVNGNCETNSSCICSVGYEIEDSCKSYHCILDTENPCNWLGICELDACNCKAPSVFLNQSCFDCQLVVNGICDSSGITCDIGWDGKYCDQFDCNTNTDSCLTKFFKNSCKGTECQCQYLNQLVGGQCIQFCDFPVVGVEVSKHETSNNNQGSVIQIRPGDRNSNLCVIGCPGCPFKDGAIKCNNGVRFSEQVVNGVKVNQCDGCLPHYSGDTCDDCDPLSIKIDGFCFVKCPTCSGNCYFDQFDIIHCLTCSNNFKLPDCQECEDWHILVDGVCMEICKSCHGQCYINESSIVCMKCEAGYDIGTACQGCASGYEEVNMLCLQKCINCTQGDCFYYQGDIICTKCTNGATLPQCMNCLENFALHEQKCQPLIPGTDCIVGNCFSCNGSEVLVNDTCYPKCSLPFCENGECYTNVIAQCVSCLPGYEMQINGSCLEIEYFPGGFCTVDNPPTCTCYPGYKGEKCDECSFEQPSGENNYCSVDCALDPTTDCNGVCRVIIIGALAQITCDSCDVGYRMPDCQQCDEGYKNNSSNNCKECDGGYIYYKTLPSRIQSKLGPGCYKYCDLCEYGDCWLRGMQVVCLSCELGYDIKFNCQKCTDGYKEVGGRCLAISDTPKGQCGSYSSQVCISCNNDFLPIQCTECSLGSVVQGEKCITPLHNILENCFMVSETNFMCDSSSTCVQGWFEGDIQKCSVCNDTLILINDSCWMPLLKKKMKYSGYCLYDVIQEVSYCERCQPEFRGKSCDQCAKGFIQCLNFSCCLIDQNLSSNGVCFQQEDKTICNTCATGYLMADQLCLKHTLKRRIGWWWILLVLGIMVIILFLYFMFSKKGSIKVKRHKLKVRTRRFFFQFIKIFVGIIICQIIALCIALQDAYVDDIYLYAASTSVGSMPFVLALFLLQPPSLDKFYYHKTSDFFMFFLGGGLDFIFQAIIYLLLPEALSVSQTIFKCFSAPFSMLLFTFIIKMKYKFGQMLLLFVSVSLPLYYALDTAFRSVFTDPYLLSNQSNFSLVLDMLSTFVAIVIQASQILFLQNILGSYTEIQVMTRLGFAFCLIYTLFSIINFKSVMMSVTTQIESMLIAIFLVFIMNVLLPMALIFISPLAVTFNMLTSAVWVEIIDAFSIQIEQNKSFYPIDLYPPIFTCFMFVLVFVSLIYYYVIANRNFEKFNIKINASKEKKVFTVPYLALKKQQKTVYYDMTKVKIITSGMLHNKVVKQKKVQQNVLQKPLKLVCIDRDTGKILQIPKKQPVMQQQEEISQFPQLSNMSDSKSETLIL